MKRLILSIFLLALAIPARAEGANVPIGQPTIFWRNNEWETMQDGRWVPYAESIRKETNSLSAEEVTAQPSPAPEPQAAPEPEAAPTNDYMGYWYGGLIGLPTPDHPRHPHEKGRGKHRAHPDTGIGQPFVGIGQPNTGIGQQPGGLGQPNTPIGQQPTGIGQPNVGIGQTTISIGQRSPAIGQPNVPIGRPNLGLGQQPGGLGQPNTPIGHPTISIGQQPTGIGQPTISIGQQPGFHGSSTGFHGNK